VSHLSNEIHEQPEVLTRLLDRQAETAARIAAAIRTRDVRYAVIAARGTSDNAARYAQYLFGALNQLPVALATPSLFSIYRTPPQLRDALVLGISQSGQSPDIVAVIEEGRRQGALTVAATNAPDSPLAHATDHILPLDAGEERAVAATKTYTAQLAALALLAVQLAGDGERLASLRSTAFEIALKLKELSYIVAEPYSSADFRHGPVAIVERGFPAVVVTPQGAVYPDTLALAHELAAREAELIVISEQDEALRLARTPLRLPVALPEWLSPFTSVLPGQLLALHITLAKGYDPDHPRGLKKITETQ
jgi:glucosamine--fructose-6-phosphate aminotransferase (isomerizing)